MAKIEWPFYGNQGNLTMEKGFLSQYFVSVAAKRLSAVEVDPQRSNQHEFNGTRELKSVLGLSTGEKIQFHTRFIWFGGINEGVVTDGFVTWYDARANHPTRSEYRLYFPTNEVMDLGQEGDAVFIAKRTDETLLIIITPSHSTLENQLIWLFGESGQLDLNFTLKDFRDDDQEVDYPVRFILDELGIDIEEPESDWLDELLKEFKGSFPSTKEFGLFARKHHPEEINAKEDPDMALMKWIEFEELLFKRLERHQVASRIEQGFIEENGTDVEGFVSFSLSVHNRRKSRAGHSLENHLERIMYDFGLNYTRGGKTENNSKPDFLFPGIEFYHSNSFPNQYLSILGAKTTCKDRWRQVLSEAQKIERKHLLTLEPGISQNQTLEMNAHKLQLVVPKSIQMTYSLNQKEWLWNLREFLDFASENQKFMPNQFLF